MGSGPAKGRFDPQLNLGNPDTVEAVHDRSANVSFQGMTKPPRPDGIRNSPDRMPGLFMPPPALP